MFKRAIGVTALVALMAAPAVAQDQGVPAPDTAAAAAPATTPPAPDVVLATVDGVNITGADLATAYSAIGEAVDRVPPGQQDAMLLSLLVDMQLMANAARKEGIADTPEFAQKMAFVAKQTLQEDYMNTLIGEKITDQAVADRYKEEIAKLPKQQLSASHILVEDEAKAKDLIAQLKGGADFAKLAQENSKDPGSASRGGALGFFSAGQMVPEFEQATNKLEVGHVTDEPVKSQFGWHIIRLDDKRDFPVPPLEEVKDQIRQVLVREAYIAEIGRLKSAASIAPKSLGAVPTAAADASEQEGDAVNAAAPQ